MPSTTRIPIATILSAGLCFIASPAMADDDDITGYTRTHESTAVLDPEQSDPHALADETGSETVRVIRDEIDSPEWLAAVKKARQHVGGNGHYTLMRVILEDARDGDTIQATATKLKELTADYHGGGGEYFVIPSSGFLFFQHINTSERTNNRDPIDIGATSHGKTRLWIDVPPDGELGILGDVILLRSEEIGLLAIEFDVAPGVEPPPVAIGAVAVGGPYGKTYETGEDYRLELPLSPGTYKLLLPSFDSRRDRWDVTIDAGKTTRIRFAALSENDVRKAGERQEAYPFPVDE